MGKASTLGAPKTREPTSLGFVTMNLNVEVCRMSDHKQDSTSKPQDALFYKHLLDKLNDGVYFVDVDRRITYWNEGAARLTGFSAQEAAGRHCHADFLCHVDGSGEKLCTTRCPLSATIADRTPREAFVFLRHKDGHRVPVHVRVAPLMDGSSVIGAVEIFNDDSHRELAERRAQELRKLAYLDPLTKLANRSYLEIRLKTALQEFALSGDPFGVLIIDVDHFKSINDTHGHESGDHALTMIARTLKGLLRPDDVLGRWGGDEFVAIIHHAASHQLRLVAERCRALVRETRIIRPSASLSVTISVGGAVASAGDSLESLLQRADEMMYEGKKQGRDRTIVS